MAKVTNILFNRTLNQFLECTDLKSDKATALAEKIRSAAKNNLEKLLETIIQVNEPHKGALKNICKENVEGISEEFFLDALLHDQTDFRTTATDILSGSTTVNPDKLFRRLKSPDIPCSEIIDVLRFNNKKLKPEDIINHAKNLGPDHEMELLKLIENTVIPVNLANIRFQPDKMVNAELKIALLRYFRTVEQSEVAPMIARFLSDASKLVVLEALQALVSLSVDFDASVVLPFIASMTEVEQKLALEILNKQADARLIPNLSTFMTDKSPSRDDALAKIIAKYADSDSLEKFLIRLDKEESWTQQQVIARLQKFTNANLSDVARELTSHDQEFIRSTAQQLVINLLDDKDLEKIFEFALSDNWQVRQRAVQALGKSANRAAIPILKDVVDQWPDTAVLALKAVKQLGFSKGLEIGFACLNNTQANIQRASLETIEALTTDKHAKNIRDVILWNIPQLSDELKGYGKELIQQITKDYGLPEIDIESQSNTGGGFVEIPKSKTGSSAADTAELDKLKPGSVWMERYHIKEEIGRGAMGRVLLVEDEMVDEQLILKFMHPALTIDKRSTERFKREVKYARKVGHPNVIRVHDLLLKDNLCAISMEYFESRGIDQVLTEKGSFDSREGLKILYQVSSGMAAAHEQAVIHRDLKPSNILMDKSGQIKIVDFGIASASSTLDSTLTQTGSIIGSPAYLAPERVDGQEADHRCDIYSMGIIAYYLFSGQLPYRGQPMAVLKQHREGKARPIDQVNRLASPVIARLVSRLMAVDLKERSASMAAVRDEIKGLLDSKKI